LTYSLGLAALLHSQVETLGNLVIIVLNNANKEGRDNMERRRSASKAA
jgi:hypothetical protein